jgi:hypothetical protein
MASRQTARHLLDRAGHTILDKNGGADIIFDDINQLGSILALLHQHGLQAELSDIADTLYQGLIILPGRPVDGEK